MPLPTLASPARVPTGRARMTEKLNDRENIWISAESPHSGGSLVLSPQCTQRHVTRSAPVTRLRSRRFGPRPAGNRPRWPRRLPVRLIGRQPRSPPTPPRWSPTSPPPTANGRPAAPAHTTPATRAALKMLGEFPGELVSTPTAVQARSCAQRRRVHRRCLGLWWTGCGRTRTAFPQLKGRS